LFNLVIKDYALGIFQTNKAYILRVEYREVVSRCVAEMTKEANLTIARRVAALFLGPMLFFAFIAGWTLYFFGQKKAISKGHSSVESNSVKLIVIPPQSQEATMTPNSK
jgi:hypothetical protein